MGQGILGHQECGTDVHPNGLVEGFYWVILRFSDCKEDTSVIDEDV
jgi:hypothetical protein